MNILTLDFETYYDSEVSLRKLTTIEYIMHPQFQPILMAYSLNDEPERCAVGFKQIDEVLRQYDWDNLAVCCHNTAFDATILRERFGYVAARYIDTMSLCRSTGGHVFEGASLKAVANLLQRLGYHTPLKGVEVTNALGKRLYEQDGAFYLEKPNADGSQPPISLQAQQALRNYIAYCIDDVKLAKAALMYFAPLVTKDEMKYQDMILKCYVKPSMYLNLKTIQDEIKRVDARDEARARDFATAHGMTLAELRAVCRSAPRFTEFLESKGGRQKSKMGEHGAALFYIPERYSEKKGVVEPCYSKSFADMMDMCEYEDPDIAELFNIKLALTSSIEKSRAQRFEAIAKLNRGFGFPYVVSGAHTHRLGGAGGLNVQNLSSGRKEGQSGALKQSIVAPPGFKIIAADSSQIELRTGSWVADDQRTLNLFRNGEDPYSHQASIIYGGDPAEIKKLAKAGVEPYSNLQRPVGKSSLLSCIYGTGKVGFMNYLKVNGISLTEDECSDIVNAYRNSHPEIVNFWRRCDEVLHAMMAGGSGYFGGPDGRLFYYDGGRKVHGETVPGVRLPDGNWLNYARLCRKTRDNPDSTSSTSYAYWGIKEGKARWIYTWGSKFFENLIQALAFAIMKWQALLINDRYQIALNTHDEWGICVHQSDVEQAQAWVEKCMRTNPPWAQGLPLDCESGVADNYGDC